MMRSLLSRRAAALVLVGGLLSGWGGCGDSEPSARVRADLVGVWLRPITGLPGQEGYQFEADGRLRFVNMLSVEGVAWESTGADSIRVWSRTERYPAPQSGDLVVVRVTDTELILRRVGSGGNRHEVYARAADPFSGRWTGPDGAFLDVTPAAAGLRVVRQVAGDYEETTGRAEDDRLVMTGASGGPPAYRLEGDCLVAPEGTRFCRRLRGP